MGSGITRLARGTRYGVSAGLIGLLGVGFVPCGCAGEAGYTVVPSTSPSASSDSRNLPEAVVAQLTACARQLRAGPAGADPGSDPAPYDVAFDLEATEEGEVDAVTLTRSTLEDRGVERCLAEALRGMTLPLRQMSRDLDERGPIQLQTPESRGLVGNAMALGGMVMLIPVVIVGIGIYIVLSSRLKVKIKDIDKPRPELTCPRAVLQELEQKKDELCKRGFAANCRGNREVKEDRERLDLIPCSSILRSLEQRYACLAQRNLIEEKCYGGIVDDGHQKAIDDGKRGIGHCENLKIYNCAAGHPMANL